MPETTWAQNWIKKSDLFHTKCLFLVFSKATYWKHFSTCLESCRDRVMTAQYGLLRPQKMTADMPLAYIIILIYISKKSTNIFFLLVFLLWKIKIKTTHMFRLHTENQIFTNTGVIRWKFCFQTDVQFLLPFFFIKQVRCG